MSVHDGSASKIVCLAGVASNLGVILTLAAHLSPAPQIVGAVGGILIAIVFGAMYAWTVALRLSAACLGGAVIGGSCVIIPIATGIALGQSTVANLIGGTIGGGVSGAVGALVAGAMSGRGGTRAPDQPQCR